IAPLSVFFFQAEDGIRDFHVTGVQTCALPIYAGQRRGTRRACPFRTRLDRSRGVFTRWANAGRCRDGGRLAVFGGGRCYTNRTKIGRASCRERVGEEGDGGTERERKRRQCDRQ